MSFKVVITQEDTEIQGTKSDLLIGLLFYIDALKDIGISNETIKKVIDMHFKENQEEKKENKGIETIVDNDEMKIQKLDLEKMTEKEANEELKKMLREIFKKMSD